MRLCMLNHNGIWRCTFFRCFYFARQLVAQGHQVTILTISPSRRFGVEIQEIDGVQIAAMSDLLWGMGRTGWDPWDTWNRISFLRGREFDIVHAFDSRPAVIHPALAYRKRTGAPLVIDWCDWWGRGGIISRRRNPLLRGPFSPIETFYEEHFVPVPSTPRRSAPHSLSGRPRWGYRRRRSRSSRPPPALPRPPGRARPRPGWRSPL